VEHLRKRAKDEREKGKRGNSKDNNAKHNDQNDVFGACDDFAITHGRNVPIFIGPWLIALAGIGGLGCGAVLNVTLIGAGSGLPKPWHGSGTT
jgi:hypothetical protein